jgi:hypothetical protein
MFESNNFEFNNQHDSMNYCFSQNVDIVVVLITRLIHLTKSVNSYIMIFHKNNCYHFIDI